MRFVVASTQVRKPAVFSIPPKVTQLPEKPPPHPLLGRVRYAAGYHCVFRKRHQYLPFFNKPIP